MDKILLPIDVSGISDKTFDIALDFAKKFNATIILLNVIKDAEIMDSNFNGLHAYHTYYHDITLYNKYYAEERAGLLSKISEQILSKVSEQFDKNAVHTQKVIEYGNPSDQIINVAKEYECDLIIIPNKNESTIKSFFLGSNTDKVVHHAQIPVLVVK